VASSPELAARLESEDRVKTLVIVKDLSRPTAVDEIYLRTLGRVSYTKVEDLEADPRGLGSSFAGARSWGVTPTVTSTASFRASP
jgi:hypothetical protein